MDPLVIWIALAGALLCVELITGTVVLLAISVGPVAAAAAAYAGASISMQIIAAAVFSTLATLLWKAHNRSKPKRSFEEDSFDVGQNVTVDGWNAEGGSMVRYRGAPWEAKLLAGQMRSAGVHRVVGMDGNVLILAPLVSQGAELEVV